MKTLKPIWKRVISGAMICTTIALLSACGGSSSSSSSNSGPIYTAIFDAGSSGTRLSFFKVTPGNGGYPIIDLIAKFDNDNQDVPNDDGINDFLNGKGFITLSSGESLPQGCPRTTGLGQTDVEPCVLQPLLKQLDTVVAAQGITKSQVKVELFATAGMRTEEIYNGGSNTAETIRQYYEQMKSYVAQWGYNTGQFKTINGNSEEGLWTWINLNDQYFNAFGGNKTYWTDAPTTRGNFEVGGSSMQIAFPTTQITPSPDNNVYTVTINGYTYNVYSKTYLGLGGDDARKFMRSYGFNTASGYNYGTDCFGSGATSANTIESSGIRLFYDAIFYPNSTTITSNAVDNEWNPLIDPESQTLAYTLPLKWPSGTTGSFNATTCTSKYNAIINSVMALPRNSFGTIPNQQTPSSYASFANVITKSSAAFIGIDGFWWAPKFLGLTSTTSPVSTYTQSQYQQAYNATCNSSYVGGTKNIQAARSCADATYMQDFLWRANGLFTSANSPRFEGSAPNDFNGKEVLTWTRGYLLKTYAN